MDPKGNIDYNEMDDKFFLIYSNPLRHLIDPHNGDIRILLRYINKMYAFITTTSYSYLVLYPKNYKLTDLRRNAIEIITKSGIDLYQLDVDLYIISKKFASDLIKDALDEPITKSFKELFVDGRVKEKSSVGVIILSDGSDGSDGVEKIVESFIMNAKHPSNIEFAIPTHSDEVKNKFAGNIFITYKNMDNSNIINTMSHYFKNMDYVFIVYDCVITEPNWDIKLNSKELYGLKCSMGPGSLIIPKKFNNCVEKLSVDGDPFTYIKKITEPLGLLQKNNYTRLIVSVSKLGLESNETYSTLMANKMQTKLRHFIST